MDECSRRSVLACAAASLSACASSSASPRPDWLLGTWQGGTPDHRQIQRMTVTSIDASEVAAQGVWGDEAVVILVNGVMVHFFTPAGSSVQLVLNGERTLLGTVDLRPWEEEAMGTSFVSLRRIA